jgi:hypothetical protein
MQSRFFGSRLRALRRNVGRNEAEKQIRFVEGARSSVALIVSYPLKKSSA